MAYLLKVGNGAGPLTKKEILGQGSGRLLLGMVWLTTARSVS
jgi:hypothetical protein